MAFIRLDLLLLALDRHPDAIQLDHGGHISDGFGVYAADQSLDLVDPFIERSQTHTSLNRRAPALLEMA